MVSETEMAAPECELNKQLKLGSRNSRETMRNFYMQPETGKTVKEER
jgi:hypothetical protein